MRITFTKGEKNDRLDIVRDDQSHVSTVFPHKGPIPHDFVHLAVESELGFDRGFWGMVAGGHHPEAIQEMAKAAGHASAKRAEVPAAHFVEAIQAERIVEAFEADYWSGGQGDPGGVTYMAEAGCRQSLVPPVESLDESAVIRIRQRIADVGARWTSIGAGEEISVDWGTAQ